MVLFAKSSFFGLLRDYAMCIVLTASSTKEYSLVFRSLFSLSFPPCTGVPWLSSFKDLLSHYFNVLQGILFTFEVNTECSSFIPG